MATLFARFSFLHMSFFHILRSSFFYRSPHSNYLRSVAYQKSETTIAGLANTITNLRWGGKMYNDNMYEQALVEKGINATCATWIVNILYSLLNRVCCSVRWFAIALWYYCFTLRNEMVDWQRIAVKGDFEAPYLYVQNEWCCSFSCEAFICT